jgi:FlaA1/EpsC-like NDP-sugar epimerase
VEINLMRSAMEYPRLAILLKRTAALRSHGVRLEDESTNFKRHLDKGSLTLIDRYIVSEAVAVFDYVCGCGRLHTAVTVITPEGSLRDCAKFGTGSGVNVMAGCDLNFERLLGRAPLGMDLETVRRELHDKCVMVTGAGGSIGSELCRQILRLRPPKLVAVDRDETAVFYLHRELSGILPRTEFVCCVGDVGDADLIRRTISRHKVDHVFHTAAYKHVSVMEENVAEAMRNNVFALKNLLDIAEGESCKSVVHISSDKAVNPTSIMGASKRIGELLLSARPASGMHCVSVRFGNVLRSNGSVVQIFEEQLRRGQPLTVTHPDIRRFFMTIPEAAALVLQAFIIGKGGDILVFDMGAPTKILDIARAVIRLHGKSEASVEIRFIGLRPGEKLEEELFYPYEKALPTSCDQIKRISASDLNWLRPCEQLEELRACLYVDGARPIREKIKEIVPEYREPSERADSRLG